MKLRYSAMQRMTYKYETQIQRMTYVYCLFYCLSKGILLQPLFKHCNFIRVDTVFWTVTEHHQLLFK